MTLQSKRNPVYRVDKIEVPAGSVEEFLSRVKETHVVLRNQPGFVRDWILKKVAGPSNFNFVTIVEWASKDAMENAGKAVATFRRAQDFDTNQFMKQVGIIFDMGSYEPLDL